MKKLIILIFIFYLKLHGTLPFKPWLAFAYYAGHNDLFSFLDTNLGQLPAGANNNVNILSSYNAFQGCGSAPNCSFVTTQRYVSSSLPTGNVQIGSTIDGLNTADQTTFVNELTFAINQAPDNNHFIIFLGGHGNGPANGCCLDQQNGAYLTDVNIQNGLKSAMQLRGKKTDILAFDCCYMGCLEYYYACANYTNYIIASEEEDPENGLPYNLCLNLLKKNNISSLNFAKGIVNAFKATYTVSSPGGTPFNHFTLAAIDSSKVVSIAQNVNSVAKIFLSLLGSSSTKQISLNLINKSLSNLTQFPDAQPNGINVDLKSWYTNLVSNAGSNQNFKQLITQVNAGIRLINQAVVANGTNVKGASGITILMPLFPGKFCCKPTYTATLFAQAFPNWLTFLNTVKTLQNT